MQNGPYCMGTAPGPNVFIMGAFSDLAAMATGVKSTISLNIWFILKVWDLAYTGIYDFLYQFLNLFSLFNQYYRKVRCLAVEP